MRPLLTALLPLLLLPAPASAATLSSTAPIPGHAAGSFGLSEDFGPLAGGAAWSADSSVVWTLDTTRELKRWRAADGALLSGRLLAAPARLPDQRPDFPNAQLTLRGVANASGLPITARGSRGDQPVALGYRLNTGSGQETPDQTCPPSLSTGLTCSADGAARAWVEGGEVRWQRGEGVTRLPVPAGSALKQVSGQTPFSLSLSPDGRRLALLLLEGKDIIFGGKGTLLTWTLNAQGAAKLTRTPLAGPLLYLGAHLSWAGERVLMASNVYNTGDEYGSGGAKLGQRLMLVTPGQGTVWALEAGAGLRGAYPSPDGSLFVTVRDGSVPELRRVADGSFVRSLGAAVRDAVPLGGGRTLLAVQGSAGFGRIVRHAPGRLETLYRGPLVPQSLAVSRDGTRIAVAGGEDGRTLRLLDASGRTLREWRADKRVSDLAFSPDGLVLSAVSGWGDGGVQAWRVADGTAYTLPQGTQFPVSQVVIRKEEGRQNGSYRRRHLVTERGSGRELWQTPWHSAWFGALVSPGGEWLAQSGYTAATVGTPEPGREVDTVNRFSRVDARTGKGGPVLSVPVAHPDDPYAGWSIAAFDGQHVLLSEGSGDGCGAQLYGYQLADLAGARLLNTPARLGQGYARLMGCGYYAPRPEADFAPDGRLLIRDGNRLDWWTL